jgi:hypothetical protein
MEKIQKLIKEQEAQGPMKRYQMEWEEHLWWQSWLQAPDQPLLLLPDWAPKLDELFAAFSGWKRCRLPSLEDEIQGFLTSLGESTQFFRKIVGTNRADGFTGRIHCEASLASIAIDTAESVGANLVSQELLQVMKVRDGILACFHCQCLIACDRVLEMSLEYQNVAAQHALVSSST